MLIFYDIFGSDYLRLGGTEEAGRATWLMDCGKGDCCFGEIGERSLSILAVVRLVISAKIIYLNIFLITVIGKKRRWG